MLCTKGKEAGVDVLYMFSNNLTGTLPLELQQLSNVWMLSIYGNKMMGGPIARFFANMTSLELLGLNGNEVTGTIPEWSKNLTNLLLLHFRDNKLDGTIPTQLGQLTSLGMCAFKLYKEQFGLILLSLKLYSASFGLF